MTERELFESKFGKPHHWIVFDEVKSKYACEQNPIDHHLLICQARWEAWQASANREGYKLVPVEMSWEKADELASAEWDKNKAHQIMSDYKKVVGAVE